jgi:NADH-quinone oxidoreductase subunit I
MIIKRKKSTILDFLTRITFFDFMKGFSVTLGAALTWPITMRYPDKEKWIPYPRFRGAHTLSRDESGKELCVACELCSRACPTDCITVVPEDDTENRGISDRVAKVWKVDLVRCLFCGYCEDACPTLAVRLGRDYELACTDLSCTTKDREELLKGQETPETFGGGVVVSARYDRKAVKVNPDLLKQRDWWKVKKS